MSRHVRQATNWSRAQSWMPRWRAVLGWSSLGAHLWQDAYGAVYYTGQDPARVFMPHVVFQPSRDALTAMGVEEPITRLDTWHAYLAALMDELRFEEHALHAAGATGYPALEDAPVVVQVRIHATPAQRCRAAVAAVNRVADA